MPRFLDCATTMLYEEFQRVGHSAFDAFDQVRTWAEGTAPSDGSPAERKATEEPAPDNARSMQQFMGMLSGVGGMPG